MTATIDKIELRAALKELLKEEKELLRAIVRELIEEEALVGESDVIGEDELRFLAKRQFKKYASVFKALA